MTAASANTTKLDGKWTRRDFTLQSGQIAYQGAVACIQLGVGTVKAAGSGTDLLPIGWFAEKMDATSAAKTVQVELFAPVDIAWLKNDTGTAVATTDIGGFCYVKDDLTVSGSSNGSTRSIAGRVWAVDATKGVAVEHASKAMALSTAPTVTDYTSATHDHSTAAAGGAIKMQTGTTLTFTAGAVTVTPTASWQHYKIPATSQDSTVTLGTSGAARGWVVVFTADASANDYTVAYRQSSTTIVPALSALKKHVAMFVFDGTYWVPMVWVDDGPVARLQTTVPFAAGDAAIDPTDSNALYVLSTTATNSTVSLGNTYAKAGWLVRCTADGSKNGHTITLRDGTTAITAASTASKRVLFEAIFDGTNWIGHVHVGP